MATLKTSVYSLKHTSKHSDTYHFWFLRIPTLQHSDITTFRHSKQLVILVFVLRYYYYFILSNNTCCLGSLACILFLYEFINIYHFVRRSRLLLILLIVLCYYKPKLWRCARSISWLGAPWRGGQLVCEGGCGGKTRGCLWLRWAALRQLSLNASVNKDAKNIKSFQNVKTTRTDF